MTLPDAMHLPVQCMSDDDFQVCANCTEQTHGLILRHWRFAWSLTCEACGRSLVARLTADGILDRLRLRAARGAATLKTVVQANDIRAMRRIALALDVLKVLDLAPTGPLTSRSQLERLTALAALDVCATRPLLGAAILLRNNERSFRQLRRTFPQHRRLIEKVRKLSQDLERRLLRKQKSEPTPKQETQTANRPAVTDGALQAARHAISELGPDADRQVLLARADAIWKCQSCVR